MGPRFDNMTVIDDDDVVGVADGAQAMGDDDGRPAFHESVQGSLNDLFTFRIEGRRRFIEDEDAGIFKNSSGDGNALPLTAGQGVAPVADEGLVTAGQSHDKFMGIGSLSRSDDFIIRRVEAAVEDVFANAGVKEHRFLGHEADLLTKGGKGDIPYVDAVNQEPPCRNVIKARHQVGHRRLAGTTGADEGDDFPGTDFEVEIGQSRVFFIVGKGNVIEGHFPFLPGAGPWHLLFPLRFPCSATFMSVLFSILPLS